MSSPISNLNPKSHHKNIVAIVDGNCEVLCDDVKIFNSTTNDGCEAEVWIKNRLLLDSLGTTEIEKLLGKTFTEIGSKITWHILNVKPAIPVSNDIPKTILCLRRLEDNVHASDE